MGYDGIDSKPTRRRSVSRNGGMPSFPWHGGVGRPIFRTRDPTIESCLDRCVCLPPERIEFTQNIEYDKSTAEKKPKELPSSGIGVNRKWQAGVEDMVMYGNQQ